MHARALSPRPRVSWRGSLSSPGNALRVLKFKNPEIKEFKEVLIRFGQIYRAGLEQETTCAPAGCDVTRRATPTDVDHVTLQLRVRHLGLGSQFGKLTPENGEIAFLYDENNYLVNYS